MKNRVLRPLLALAAVSLLMQGCAGTPKPTSAVAPPAAAPADAPPEAAGNLNAELAEAAGALRPLPRSAGLSLGDRCRLALARRHGAIALTTDRARTPIAEGVGVTIDNLRPAS